MIHRFTAGNYGFWQDADGYWQVAYTGQPAPKAGVYGRADGLAGLKGVPAHLVPAEIKREDDLRAQARMRAKVNSFNH